MLSIAYVFLQKLLVSSFQLSCYETEKAYYRSLLLSKGRTVVKYICECNQSMHKVVFDPEPVVISIAFCAYCLFCSLSVILLFQQPCVMNVISRILPRIIPPRNCGNSHQSKLCRVGKHCTINA